MKFVFLSEDFYKDYNIKECKELLHKEHRPYVMLLARIDGVLFAIPFRSCIKHSYCFKTVGYKGLDYLKAVVITDVSRYTCTPDKIISVDNREFHKILFNKDLVIKGFKRFLKEYKKAVMLGQHYKRFSYCALQYFHKELGLLQE